MASSDSFLLAPGESLRSSQVISPSAQGGLATVASAPVQNGVANAVTQDASRTAPEVPHQGNAQLSGIGGDLLRADVYDPTMMVGGASAVFQCMAPPDMAEPAREPQMERDEASSHTTAAATAQALAIASTIPQQQTTDQGYYATSPMASRISSRTAEQMPASGASHPMVRWVSRLTEFLRTSTSRGVGGYEAMATTGFLQEAPSELAMTPARFAGVGADPLSRTGTPAQAMLTFSPPEELPPRPGPPVLVSWAQGSGPQSEPLFSREQIRRVEELQAQAPLLFPRQVAQAPTVAPPSSDETSTHSSMVKAEVQRQLESYDHRQRMEIQRLQREIFSLRAEMRKGKP